MKRIAIITLAVVMLAVNFCFFAISTGAAVEGDWAVSRAADDYKDPDSYRPYCGYKYEMDRGLVLISADYTNNTPYTHVHTKKKYNLQDNNAGGNNRSVTMEFTVTDFAYGGESGNKDHWVGISLHSQEIFAPGQTGYGEGVSILIRGAGSGAAIAQFFYLDDASGYKLFSEQHITIPVNEQGHETYTFEVEYTQWGYTFYLCGTEVYDTSGAADHILNTYCADGAYVGLSFYCGETGSKIGANISKFQGEVPYGEDSAEPEENRNNFAPIADSATVPAGQPALIWNSAKEQFNQFQGSNIAFDVNDDGTIKATALDNSGYVIFSPKVSVSYQAADFPVIAVLTRNCYAQSGKIYYSAGDIMGAQPDCSAEFDLAEYDYGQDWCMGILDLTDDLDWKGRVNMIRADFSGVDYTDPETQVYDIAYIAAFRTIEDAEKYAQDYLVKLLGQMPETEEATSEQPEQSKQPEETVTDVVENKETQADSEQTTESESKKGCGSVIALPIMALVALLGAAFVSKKK